MSITVPLSLLDKPSDHPEVKQVLASLGAPAPKLKKGDVDAYSEAKDHGVYLTFKDEGQLRNDPKLAIGEGALILVAIGFQTSAAAGYQTYAGQLPFGVTFSMPRPDVHALLGAPEKTIAPLAKDRWTRDGVRFHVQFAKGFGPIHSIQASLPMP
jgi:hypothetical protein